MNRPLVPTDFTDARAPVNSSGMSTEQKRQLWSPIVTGGVLILVLVVGLFVWAAISRIAGGVPAPGAVMVENNRKSVQHLDGGIIRAINVREGQQVRQGQVLFSFDDTQPRAQVDVLRNQYDGFLAQRARLEAELAGARTVTFPPELLNRRSDPRVAGMIRDQETLFRASLGVYVAQAGALGQRVEQLNTRVQGLSAQVESVNQQSALINDELDGVKSLYERGFAPKSRLLGLQRNAASLTGERGARTAEIAGAGEAIGETRIQLAQLRQQRAAQSAESLREVQIQIADILPRLRAAEAALSRTQVRSPADGYVFGLTQFTEGGVARAGDRLLDVVPTGAPLVVRVRIPPQHIDEVHRGMSARVMLTAYKSQKVPPIDAKVVAVSADQIATESGESFFTADLIVDRSEMDKLGPSVQLTPGMPASALIVTGERSVLDYVIAPLRDTIRNALHEE